jgi:hypothetical protein
VKDNQEEEEGGMEILMEKREHRRRSRENPPWKIRVNGMGRQDKAQP